MNNHPFHPARNSRGSSLLIVLAFLLLLTTITVAFLSRSTLERQLSNASFSQGKTDFTAQGSIAAIIGDLQQEIVAGSNVGQGTTIPTLSAGYYYPNSPITVVPSLVVPGYTSSSIVGTGLENLVKISKNGSAFYTGTDYTATGPSRASAVNSASAVSLNNRSVTRARWNAPLLMAKATPGIDTDLTPVNAFTAPDWIYVARDGSNPTTWDTMYRSKTGVSLTTAASPGNPGTNPVTQRYAYAIYDEGSTLDLNVAGSPTTIVGGNLSYSGIQPYKNALAYADLAQLPYLSTTAQPVAGTNSSTLTAAQQKIVINAIVGWRNLYSAQVTAGKFPGSATAYTFPTTTVAANVTSTLFPAGSALSPFDLNTLFNPSGYLSTGGILGKTTTGSVIKLYNNNPNQNYGNSTDNAFTSRQQLIQFFTQGLGQNTNGVTSFVSTVAPSPAGTVTTLAMLQNVLQYLGTFSRDISQPSYAPDPRRPAILATASGGNDAAGITTANALYPTSGPTVNDTLNPPLLGVTAASAFTRNNGSTAVVGEPLVKKRFALNRLAWLTFQGPSSARSYASPSSTQFTTNAGTASANGDYDLYLLENKYGIPASFLAQGNAANIYKYFGLSWVPDSRGSAAGATYPSSGTGDGQNKWVYNHTLANPAAGVTASPITSLPSHSGTVVSTSATTSSITRILTLSQVAAAGRDPDFFELLKATMTAGSLGKFGTPVAAAPASLGLADDYNNGRDTSLDAQVIQIGANIIAQSQTSGVPPRILFDDQSWPQAQEYRGVEDFPYLYSVSSGWIRLQDSTPPFATLTAGAAGGSPSIGAITANPTLITADKAGLAAVYEIPTIWNPHALNPLALGTAAQQATYAASIGPRPTHFRLVAITGTPNMSNPSTPVVSGTNGFTVEGGCRNITTISGSSTTTTVTTGDAQNGKTTTTVTTKGTTVYYGNGNLDDAAIDAIGGRKWLDATTTNVEKPMSLTQANSEIDFDIPLTTASNSPWVDLFREPTILDQPSVPTPCNLRFGPSNFVRSVTATPSLALNLTNGNGGLEDSYSANDANYCYTTFSAYSATYPGVKDLRNSTGTKPASIGICLGLVPLVWNASLQVTTQDTTQDTVITTTNGVQGAPAVGSVNGTSTTSGPSANYIIPTGNIHFSGSAGQQITYRIQYADPISNPTGTAGGNWCTYDEKYMGPANRGPFIYYNWNDNLHNAPVQLNNFMTSSPLVFNFSDPRTGRFGAYSNGTDNYGVNIGVWETPLTARDQNGTYTGGVFGWAGPTTNYNKTSPGLAPFAAAASQNAIWTFRPDEQSGFSVGYNAYTPTPDNAWGWYYKSNSSRNGLFRPGLLCQNNPLSSLYSSVNSFGFFNGATNGGVASQTQPGPIANLFYADPDGVVRRGMSAYVQPSLALSFDYSPAVARPAGAPSGIPLNWAHTFNATGQAVPNTFSVTASTPGGTATVAMDGSSRPVILNRPFRSVAELGYVFTGTPWRNLDFSTPESGSSALLDAFCINDTNDPNGLVAGKINLNTRQASVLQAVLAGAYKDELNASSAYTSNYYTPTSSSAAIVTQAINGGTSTIGSADTIAKALVSRTTDSANIATGSGPLRNVAELVGKYNSSVAVTASNGGTMPGTGKTAYDGGQSYTGFSGTATTVSGTAPSANPNNLSSVLYLDNKNNGPNLATYATMVCPRYREATVRALSNAGTTRVWNLMIDVIAQTGRFPSSAGSLANFNVEGERRYWVHVAIDRYTGKVLDQQIEEVKE